MIEQGRKRRVTAILVSGLAVAASLYRARDRSGLRAGARSPSCGRRASSSRPQIRLPRASSG